MGGIYELHAVVNAEALAQICELVRPVVGGVGGSDVLPLGPQSRAVQADLHVNSGRGIGERDRATQAA